MTALSNPATLIFYSAFFPQFLQPDQTMAPQILILGTIFLVLSSSLELTLVGILSHLRSRRDIGAWRFGRFPAIASAAVYFSVAAIAALGFTAFPV